MYTETSDSILLGSSLLVRCLAISEYFVSHISTYYKYLISKFHRGNKPVKINGAINFSRLNMFNI